MAHSGRRQSDRDMEHLCSGYSASIDSGRWQPGEYQLGRRTDGLPISTPYTASKISVVGLSVALANELAAQNIRVNSVHPTGAGMIPTALGDLLGGERADLIPIFVNAMPTPCIDPIDVSHAELYLISDEARFVTGLQFKVGAGVNIKWAM